MRRRAADLTALVTTTRIRVIMCYFVQKMLVMAIGRRCVSARQL
jgi:hypothetical protein